MAPSEHTPDTQGQSLGIPEVGLAIGTRCLLNVMGGHFLVKILEVGKDTMRVSFPGKDYPVENVRVDLEFHDDTGFFYYSTEVVKGPSEIGDGVILRRPTKLQRNLHRESCRVTTDLTVQVKDQVHVRKYDAALIDISGGGALVESEAPFDFSTTVELTLSLPGEPTHVILGQVIHVPGHVGHERGPAQIFGIRFIDVDPEARRSISRYIWQRLQALYASSSPDSNGFSSV